MVTQSADPHASRGVAPRYAAALAALGLQAGHRVLEIGCGHGVLVGLMCQAVGPNGVVHALDRSSKMIAATAARSADWVESGRARLHAGRIQDLVFEDNTFDRVVAVRVRELWDDAAVALPRAAEWLAADGLLCLAVDGPDGDRVGNAVAAAAAALGDHGFRDIGIVWPETALAVVTARR